MHRDRVAQHRRDDHGTARPRLDDVPRPLVVLAVHLLDQVVVHKGALLKATRHYRVLLPLLLAAPADDQAVAGLVFGAGPAFGLAPADRAILAPPPGRSSMACTMVPVGMLRSGRQFPGRMSALGPFSTRSPCRRPCGHRM